MAFKDFLLPLVGDPGPATVVAIDRCVAMAADIGARLTAIAIEVESGPTLLMSTELAFADTLEKTRSFSNVHEMLSVFESASLRLGALNKQAIRKVSPEDISAFLSGCARLTDLTIFPMKTHNGQCQDIVEQLIFGSGRPVLLCPEETAATLGTTFDTIAIAWDNTGPVARAIADAMPLLQAAASVHIFTVIDSETPAEGDSGAALASHLAMHGVAASFETVKRGGASVGKVFEAVVKAKAADLLVMGAYRHSRMNEWIWGGASNTIIAHPPCWVLMSH